MFFIINEQKLELLFANFNLKLQSNNKSEYLFFDTFSNELLNNGYYIVKYGNKFELRDLQNGVCESDSVAKNAKFYWEFSDDNFKTRLEDLIEYRALVQKSKLSFEQDSYIALNSSEKGVFRVFIYKTEDKIVAEIKEIKGYAKNFSTIKKFFEPDTHIDSLFDLVKTKTKVLNKPELKSSMQSYDAIKLLLEFSYKKMRSEEEGILKNIDSEFLHYYRVDLRKARALVSQFKSVFEQKDFETLKIGLSKIGKITNQARDLDVYWLSTREYIEKNPNIDLDNFLKYLKTSSNKEYKKLAKFFSSDEYFKICKTCEDILGKKTSKAKDANKKIINLLGKKIAKLHMKILNESSILRPDSEDVKFHELRIDCKKLRYLLEFFEALFNKPEINIAIKLIKNLQTILGDFQDSSVQKDKIIDLADGMTKSLKSIDSNTLISIGVLVGELNTKQEKSKIKFFDTIIELNKKENIELFNRLY